MKSFKEFLEKDLKKPIFQRIISHPKVIVKSIPEQSFDGAEWIFIDQNLNAKIIISEEYLNKTYEKLNADDFEKNFFDEDVGLIPHELTEAYLTGLIMQKKFDQIPSKFIDSFNFFKRDFEKLLDRYKFSILEIHQKKNIYNHFGGYVHDMIVKSIPEYNSWLNHIYQEMKK